MNKYRLNLIFMLLISGLAFGSNPAYGESHSYDFHANAKMLHKHHGPIEKAYGLVNVVTNNDGKGTIDVMFSNGSKIDWAKFNAQVRFLSTTGSVIREEHIYRWLDAADKEGATERRVIKSLTVDGFDRIEVEFFVTDIPEQYAVRPNGFKSVELSSVGRMIQPGLLPGIKKRTN